MRCKRCGAPIVLGIGTSRDKCAFCYVAASSSNEDAWFRSAYNTGFRDATGTFGGQGTTRTSGMLIYGMLKERIDDIRSSIKPYIASTGVGFAISCSRMFPCPERCCAIFTREDPPSPYDILESVEITYYAAFAVRASWLERITPEQIAAKIAHAFREDAEAFFRNVQPTMLVSNQEEKHPRVRIVHTEVGTLLDAPFIVEWEEAHASQA